MTTGVLRSITNPAGTIDFVIPTGLPEHIPATFAALHERAMAVHDEIMYISKAAKRAVEMYDEALIPLDAADDLWELISEATGFEPLFVLLQRLSNALSAGTGEKVHGDVFGTSS